MILERLKRRSNQIYLRKNYESFLKNSNSKAPKNVQKILLILDDIAYEEVFQMELCSQFGIPTTQVEILRYSDRKSKKEENPAVISSKDFGWYGKIPEGQLKEVLTKRFDLLIYYGKIENLYTDLLILQLKADLKVGLGTLNSDNFDLLIQCEASNTKVFVKELKKYLEILK